MNDAIYKVQPYDSIGGGYPVHRMKEYGARFVCNVDAELYANLRNAAIEACGDDAPDKAEHWLTTMTERAELAEANERALHRAIQNLYPRMAVSYVKGQRMSFMDMDYITTVAQENGIILPSIMDELTAGGGQ